MRKSTWPLAIALACAAVPLAAAVPTTSTAQRPVEDALLAIGTIDDDRLLSDRDYAAEILGHLDVLRSSEHYTGEAKLGVDAIRMIALMGVGRDREAFKVASEVSRTAPGNVDFHYMAFFIGSFVNPAAALEELERADAHLKSAEDRARFRAAIDDDLFFRIRHGFHQNKDKAAKARFAAGLLKFGWPEGELIDVGDSVRMDVVEGRLAGGDVPGARAVAAGIVGPRALLLLLVDRRYDAVTSGTDPLQQLEKAIATHQSATAAALAGKAADGPVLLQRAQALRSVGRETDALNLLMPKVGDMAAIKAMGEDGFWLVNEAAYSLLALNRSNEAVSTMDRLLALGLRENPLLISMAINRGEIMMGAGRYREAADYGVKLFNESAGMASPYGQMWMWETAACGYSLAGEAKAAAPWLARLREKEKDNEAAVTRALLCANDLDAAAAAVVRRLNGEDPGSMLVALQDYTIQQYESPSRKLLESRVKEVMQRADVASAITKRGRILKLPLSKIYWGAF